VKRLVSSSLAALLLASSLATAACTPHTVEPGTVGVLAQWGEVHSDSKSEGLHWETWFRDDIVNMPLRVQKIEAKASASSKDLQVVTSIIALNYRLDGSKAVDVFQDIGKLETVEQTIVAPALQEAVKASTAKYTAQELVTKRQEVKNTISDYITATLEKSHLQVTELSIVDFKFDNKYQAAVEDKQVAEENAKKATNDLQRIEIEAKQRVAKAQGMAEAALAKARAEAEAQTMLRETLTPEILKLRAVEKWDGKMPVVTGDGSAAIVDVAAIAASAAGR